LKLDLSNWFSQARTEHNQCGHIFLSAVDASFSTFLTSNNFSGKANL